jgi:hypothetical protein
LDSGDVELTQYFEIAGKFSKLHITGQWSVFLEEEGGVTADRKIDG